MQMRLDNFVNAFRNVLAGLHLEPAPFENQQNQQQENQERFDLADLDETDSSDDNEQDVRRTDNDELD